MYIETSFGNIIKVTFVFVLDILFAFIVQLNYIKTNHNKLNYVQMVSNA